MLGRWMLRRREVYHLCRRQSNGNKSRRLSAFLCWRIPWSKKRDSAAESSPEVVKSLMKSTRIFTKFHLSEPPQDRPRPHAIAILHNFWAHHHRPTSFATC